MALTQPTDFSPAAFRRLDPTKYVALGDFIDEINAPDNRDTLVKTCGNQGITGFLKLTGAVKSNGTADSVQYWEETRLHPAQAATPTSATAADKVITLNMAAGAAKYLRLNDVLLIGGQDRFIVTAISVSEYTTGVAATATLSSLTSGGLTANLAATLASFPIVGNLFGQGTDQNSGYLESNVVKRENNYMIIKEIYKVTGSQATNIGWINLGNGDYRWYVKSENDTRQRFLDKREMMMLLGEEITNTDAQLNALGLGTTTSYSKSSQGYFAAVENRGIVNTGGISTLSDLDSIIVALDKQGAAAEYAVYVNRAQDLLFDDMIANGVGASLTSGVMTQFGAFNNSPDMAAHLGFASFMRGSYGFHKHSWKLLNEPTLLAGSKYEGVMIPMTTVADARTGEKAPALEMNYKSTNGYSRDMEHWMTGSILGVTNTNDDSLQFNYRTECNLVTRAANQHVILKAS